MSKKMIGTILVGLLALLNACNTTANSTQPTVAIAGSTQPAGLEPTPAPTATAAPQPRSLVVCLGQEPPSLYLYGDSSRSTWDVLEAIYDGPFDTRQFSVQPVILQKLPSLADGDALVGTLDVKEGDMVMDTEGNLRTLTKDLTVFPAGCSDQTCAVTWDGQAPLQMDQLSLTFKLLPGILWSDGQPLTAADTIYSFQVSSDPATPTSKVAVYQTASYQALDENSVEWKGVPGYIPTHFETYFWTPLPQHLLAEIAPADLLSNDLAARSPIGWGPYKIKEWIAGDHITLEKNPSYFRAEEGLPKFDTLVYRFLGEPADNNIAAMLAGECDVVDQTSMLDEQLETILNLQQNKKLKAYFSQGPEWEHIDFGISPAAYDDGYSAVGNDRPDIFGDVRVRQAFAYCMDRQGIIDDLLFGQTTIPVGFYPSTHPLYDAALQPLLYDVEKGRSLLTEVGWVDLDGDPDTPLQSAGVFNVPDGTSLSVTYYTSEAALRVEVAKRLASSLSECGIQLNVIYLNTANLFGAGPQGVLFGRNFDLAEFSWKVSSQPFCQYYSTSQIPNASNNWLTVNLTGFSNAEYDDACAQAVQAHPDQTDYIEKNLKVQELFNQQVPAVPLYFRLKVAISRPDFCGLEVDATTRSDLWNLENFDIADQCP